MISYKLTPRAEAELESIFAHGVERWGWDQAQRYSDDLILAFERIAARALPWRQIPAEIGVEGFRYHCGRHYIYWRASDEGATIVTLLHDAMDQPSRLRDDM